MSKMHELKELFHHIQQAWQRQEQVVLVILTDVVGSAYRLPGSKMVMTSSGDLFGTVSGGCLEADLYGWAERVFETGEPLVHQYDLSDTEIWSLGIGCKGNLQFLFLPLFSGEPQWQVVQHLVQLEQGFTLAIDMQTGELAIIEDNSSPLVDSKFPVEVVKQAQISSQQTRAQIFLYENRPYLIDTVKQNEHLIIAGAGQDAMPLAVLAYQAGFSVSVTDTRPHFNNEQRFPHAVHLTTPIEELSNNGLENSWWVIMNHHQERDRETIRLALNSQAKYIGVLGPTYRTNDLLQQIGATITSGPIYSPVGLDIGAETMEEVAISIIAEMMSLRAGRVAQSLHGVEKIHG
ncbi:MAG: XdhC family protein [Solibacillus sp.]